MECGRSSPMPSLMCWSAPDSGGASSALAAQRAKPVLGHQTQPQQPLGEGIILLCSGFPPWHLLEPQGHLWASWDWTAAGNNPHKGPGSCPCMAESRREMGKGKRGKTPGLGSRQFTRKRETMHASKAKQGIHCPLPMGRQGSRQAQQSRAPAQVTVTWED